jgi:hypothetical protein
MPIGFDLTFGAWSLLMRQAAADAQARLMPVIDRFLLQTGNLDGPGRFTDNDVLRSVYAVLATAASALIGAILVYTCMRSIFEHGFRPRYALRVMVPRLLAVVVLSRFGITLMQGAIDLNNALVDQVWLGHAPGAPASTLWRLLVNPGGNAVLVVFLFLTLLVLAVLAVTSFARNLLILLLVVTAPVAFTAMLLPETRVYFAEWRRLFFTAVFTQVLQVTVLRVAIMFTFKDNLVASIHGLVALYLVLRVPGALHAASKAESKLVTYAHHAERMIERAVNHASAPPHTSRVHAHPAV